MLEIAERACSPFAWNTRVTWELPAIGALSAIPPHEPRCALTKVTLAELSAQLAGLPERLARNVSHNPRAERIAVNQPVALSANIVHTKKKPPDLGTTVPFECTTIMPAAIRPPSSMMMYPNGRSDSMSVPYSHTTKTTTGM